MKKIIVLILILAFCFVYIFPQPDDIKPQTDVSPEIESPMQEKTADAKSFSEGASDGSVYAKAESASKWSWIGCFSGFCLYGLGCLGSTAIAYFISPQVPASAIAKGNDYVSGFKSTYISEMKGKNAKSACIGGILGNLVNVVSITVTILILIAVGVMNFQQIGDFFGNIFNF